MLPLDKAYLDELNKIAKKIQESEDLAKYLEDEEEEHYENLKISFEPLIHQLSDKVAAENPLQLINFERRLMETDFEGLFLPRLLGYSVMRGELNENYKYVVPQDHFKDILMAICNSPNFEILKKRIGQSIQIGFALSSNIWITNLLAPIQNKRIKYFLQSQQLDKFRSLEGRIEGCRVYKRQFRNFNYMTADFPKNLGELKVQWSALKEFLIYRIEKKLDNTSLIPFLKDLIGNEEFKGHDEHLQIMAVTALFFDMNEEDKVFLAKHLNETRAKHPEFVQKWLELVLELHRSDRVDLDAAADARVSALLDKSVDDELTAYYNLMDIIHGVGYVNEDAMEAVKAFYNQRQGRSLINECVRRTIFNYFAKLLNNLEVTDYHELFNLSKIYTVYIKIFANEKFNQDVKKLSMRYVKRLLKKYTDKRGKDYQDIKKFVSSTFLDLNFLKEKEIVELFKTRRRRKKAEAQS
ncbi:MAG TPA: hypothetical protein ENJ95_12950 [Bacteroidetes bacterium]|nr:hypothetical protein [Bacteroidota bacterium]